MKLMIIILPDSDGDNVVQEMVQKGYRVTRMASTGGFLRRGNITLMVGLEEEKIDDLIGLLKQVCCPAATGEHRATIFIANLPYYAQI